MLPWGRFVTMDPPILTPFPMPAEPTADVLPAATESEMLMKVVTLVPPTDTAKTARLFAEMESWMPVRSAMMASTTLTVFPMLAEPTVSCGLVEMVFSICWRSVTMEPTMPIVLIHAGHGAEFPNAVMASSILAEEKCVMMETSWMVTVVTAAADASVETVEWTLVRCAMMGLETATPGLLVAALTANCLVVETRSLTLARNAMTELVTLPDPTLADLTAPFPSVVMVLLTICMVSSVTKEDETP